MNNFSHSLYCQRLLRLKQMAQTISFFKSDYEGVSIFLKMPRTRM